MTYKGRFTKAGNSSAYAFEAALFRSHPEFHEHNVEAEYIGRGVLLVRVVDADPVIGDDPVLGAFLAFVERDMVENPSSIRPLSEDLLARAGRLVGDMDVDLNGRVDCVEAREDRRHRRNPWCLRSAMAVPIRWRGVRPELRRSPG